MTELARSESPAATPVWIQAHRDAWQAKPGLRAYYQTEIFDRIVSRLRPGRTLEFGSGPGLFAAQYDRPIVTTDISPVAGIAVCADAHQLPFADASFDNLIGIDVLHHFARPGVMLREAARGLKPGGRLILVEPWTGTVGRIIYRYFHHENCEDVADPWLDAMPADKSPLDGNAEIPRAVLVERSGELSKQVPHLAVTEIDYFGSLAYVLTGGFQGWGAPAVAIKVLIGAERLMPRPMRRVFGIRILAVVERLKR